MSMFKDSQRQKSGYDLLQRTATDYFTNDFTEGKGPFLAKVLRVKQIVGGQGHLTWVDELENNFALENPNDPNPFSSLTRVIINARISGKYLSGQPSYHSHIPEPKKLGNFNEVGIQDDVYIDLHDEFVSLNETAASAVPKVGDFVWVDYLEKKTRTRPVYLGPLKGVMGGASSPPCGTQNAPSSTFNKNSPTGNNMGSQANSPGGLKGLKTSLPPANTTYKLHGYTIKNFTRQKRFLNEPFLSQMEKLVSGVEVFHWYVQQLYPGTKVKVYDPKAATTWGHSAKSSHKWGTGFDFKAKVNGKKISNTKLWAIIIKLITAGKIPDGGVGFYQTATGPNKGKATTYGTNSPSSGCPHWDPAYPQPGEELFVNPIIKDAQGNPVLDKKGKPKVKKLLPKKSGYPTRKWYWGTKNGKTVTKNTGQTAAQLLQRPKVPRFAIQEYASLPDPDPKMPTWSNVIAMRKQQSGNKAPVQNATVPSPPAEKSTSPTPKPKDPPTDKEKDAKKKLEEEEEKKKVAAAAKAAGTGAAKAGVDLAKKEESKEKPSPAAAAGAAAAQTATAIAPCVQPGKSGGNSGIGGTPSPPKTGQVNSGTQIKFPAKGKPKALYSNSNVTTDVYVKKTDVIKNLTMFVLHETAGHGTSYGNASSRANRIKMGKTYASTNKKTGVVTHKPYTNWKQVHFWGGRAGDTALTTPINKPCGHANWCNWISVGIEVINMSNVKVKDGRIGDRITEGYKYLHPLGNVGGTAQSSGKGNGALKYATALFGKNRLYMLPSERQCRMCWDLVRWLAGPHRPHKEFKPLPILFPATANSDKLSTGFKSSIGKGSPIFVWGRFNPTVASFKGTVKGGPSYKNLWKSTLKSGARFKPTQHWQSGVVAHHRWHHSDGVFQEFYCLGRALGMSSKQAYFAAIGGLAATNKKNNSKLNAGRNNFTYFPDQKFVNYGKKIWGSNGSLNWPQKNASLVTGTKKYGKRDVANNKTKWTKALA